MMPKTQWTLFIQPDAPVKPVPGAPCNGCGVCCLAEPCPLGIVLSGRRRGACRALRWNTETSTYQCGAVVQAESVLQASLPQALGFVVPWLARGLRRLGPRWIAAGKGCDSTLQAEGLPMRRPDPDH